MTSRMKDRDLAPARRACLTAPSWWPKDKLLQALERATQYGWTGKALKAYAWAFWLDGRYGRVTPDAYRNALYVGLGHKQALSFLEHYNADPGRYSHVR